MDLALLKATQELEEERTGLFVISADMDGLKIINDTYGHAEGDVAIKTIGMILSGFSSPNIFSARTGGDEFIIGVKGSENDVKKAINTIRKKVKRFNDTASKPYKLSVSIGYERFDQNIGLVECLRRADEKMYEEKKTKKECRN